MNRPIIFMAGMVIFMAVMITVIICAERSPSAQQRAAPRAAGVEAIAGPTQFDLPRSRRDDRDAPDPSDSGSGND